MKKKYYIIIAVAIQFFYYISAVGIHTLDYFFPWGSVHDYQGWDYYQIPNAAYALLHGGDLTGSVPTNVPPYSFGSMNVYHPFFTLALGLPLQLLKPIQGFYLWTLVHIIVTAIMASILYLRFKSNKHIYFALFLYLVFFPNYLEIWAGQYHFLLNAAVIFLLLAALRKEKMKDGVIFAFSLLVKPIALLWIPTLLMHKRLKTVLIGIVIFIILTLPFSLYNNDVYYIRNLLERIQTPFGSVPSIFTLDTLLRFWETPTDIIVFLKATTAIALIIFQYRRNINLFQSLFLWVSYYLLFYDLVFEYHYTILAPFLAIGVLTQKPFQTQFAKILNILIIVPTPFFLMRFFQIFASGRNITDTGWVIIVLFRIIPVILFCSYIILQKNKLKKAHKKTSAYERS